MRIPTRHAVILMLLRLALVGVFLASVLQFYRPGLGFTDLIFFPENSHSWELPAVRETPHYDHPGGNAYDGQFYAQLAVDPFLRTPAIDKALDLPPYRARRILFSWTACILGLGRPHWVLQAYALQNVFSWLILAWWLSRRLPGDDVKAFLAWAACLFSHGLLVSVRMALIDGPSLLLIAAAVSAAERGRPWGSAALVGLGGLGRETNLLAAAALPWRWRWTRSQVLRSLGWVAIIVLPSLVWLDYLRSIYRSLLLSRVDQMAAPLSAYLNRWPEVIGQLLGQGWASPARFSLLVLVGLTVQAIYLVRRWDWHAPWWRVGFAYVLLMLAVDAAVWEGYPGAATRVLLPMTLAFNLLLPSGKAFWPLWTAGNLPVLAGIAELHVPWIWRLL
jgi:hypothetical protein